MAHIGTLGREIPKGREGVCGTYRDINRNTGETDAKG